MIIKLAGNSGPLDEASNTGNTFFNSTCIRIRPDANVIITIYDADDVQLGNTTLFAATEYFIQKRSNEKIHCGTANVEATPVATTVS